MKNILISLGISLVALYLLNAIGVGGSLMTLIMPVIPVFVYSKLTIYKTKPFIISSISGFVLSAVAYFILQIVGIMFGLGDGSSYNMAYVSVIIGALLSILIYRQLNKSKNTTNVKN